MTGHYEIHGKADKWTVRLVDGAGKTVMVSAGTYPTAAAAVDAVHVAKQDAATADTADVEVHETDGVELVPTGRLGPNSGE